LSDDWQLQVDLGQLRKVFTALIDSLEETRGNVVSINQDDFWSVSPEDLYNVYKTPESLGIGKLSESWEKLRELVEEDEYPIPYHLVWLADVLRALGLPQRSS
jgi:hypothetical protein